MSETTVTTEVQVDDTDNLDAFSDDFFGRKQEEKKPEVATTTDQEAEQDTSENANKSQETTSEDEQDEAELQEEISEKPKRKTVQDRIDEVVKQREDIRRESEAKIAELRKEFEDYKKSTQPEADKDTGPKEPKPDALDKDGEPIYALGEFDPQYIRDLTKFTFEQERAILEKERREAEQKAVADQAEQTLRTEWNGRVAEAVKEYPDFQEKGVQLLNSFNSLDDNYARYLSAVLMSMEKGPQVLYYLSNHPDEAATIVNSGAQKATLALGRIEARFLQSEQEAPKPKITKAPTPPIERARGTNGAFISVSGDTDDLDAFSGEFFKGRR